MDERQARVQEDLRGLISGEVRCDDVFVQLYASDASVFQMRPLGVVLPRTVGDVVACLEYARENGIPVHARGAGSGLAGESLGPGLVIDFSKHLRRIVAVEEDCVRVQPGVVLERLNAHLRRYGRQFGPDPAMSEVTTMGSVVSLDASGSRWLKYGSARRHVRSLQVVLADGTVLEAGLEPLRDGISHDPLPRKRDLINDLAALIRRNQALIANHQPRTRVNRAGYHLHGVLDNDRLDLARLLVGSEGTLALFTEITLATQPLPRCSAIAMLLFHRLDSAARAVQELVPLEPTTCDLLDRRLLSLARESDPRYELLIPQQTEAVLLVEFERDDQPTLLDSLRRAVDRVQRRRRYAFDSRLAFDRDDIDLFWRLSRRVVPTLYKLKGNERALPFLEDAAIPPEVLPEFLVEVQNVLKRHQVTASLFAHAAHGQLHIRPLLDLGDPQHVRILEALAEDLYERVLEAGGTVSGEHGCGLSRTPFLRRQYGPLYDVFREVKRIFDPANVLNPGKVVAEGTRPLHHALRPVRLPEPSAEPGQPPLRLPVIQLNWSPEEIMHASRACNGCGACRSQADHVRMCPIFRFVPSEEASPRAKANLVRGILTGQLDLDALSREEFKAVADLCVNCQMCRLECPASVDIPKLMIEAKGAYVAVNGLRLSDWMMARVDRVCSLGSVFAPISNWVLGNPAARWLLEKTTGIARGRKLPRFARRTFLQIAARRRLTRPARHAGRKVALFTDVYATYHDPQLAEALVAVLEHNGVSVYVPPNQKSSGMSMISVGALDLARRRAEHNVTVLAEAVRQGYHVLAMEPSAALCLMREYPALLDDEDSRLVAANTSEACTYLWNLHRGGQLALDLRPIHATLAYHMPCHLKALEVGSPGENLLRLIPALRVSTTEKGCSGMAGTFGLKRENFRNSLRAGWGLISSLRQPGFNAGTTECSTCKFQMEQGTEKPTVHPLKLLALAYGLMPELQRALTCKGQELIVT